MNHGTSCPPLFNPRGQTSGSAGPEPKSLPLQGSQRSGDLSFRKILPKVKRRKTKKERDLNKFHKSELAMLPSKGPHGFRRKQDAGHNPFCSKVVQSSVTMCTCRSNPIIITKNRLSRHQGMFNREVKSIDIERLLSPGMKRKDRPESDVPPSRSMSDGNTSLDRHLLSTAIPPGTGYYEQSVTSSPRSRCCDEKSRAAESASAVSQRKEKETATSRGQDGSHHSTTWSNSETENRTVEEQSAPVLEAALEVFKTIDVQLLFPDRNLVKETQKAILTEMEKQKTVDIHQPALPSRTKPDYGFKGLGQFNEDLQVGNVITSGSPATKIPLHDPPTMVLSQCESIPVNTAMSTTTASFGHQRSANLLHRPCLVGLGYTAQDSNRRAEGCLQDFQHIFKFTLPRLGPELIPEQQTNSDSFQTAARPPGDISPFGDLTSARQTTCTPHADFPLSFLRTNNSHEHVIGRPISSMHGEVYEWVTPARRPSRDNLPEIVGQIGSNVKRQDEGENQTSRGFLRSVWNEDNKRSETSSPYYTNPSARRARLPNRDPSQCRILFKDNVQHFQDLPPHDLETHSPSGVGNRMHDERYVSEMETLDQGIVQTPGIPGTGTESFHHDVHFPRTLFRWRSICEPHRDNSRSAKPVVKRDYKYNTWDRDCRSTDDWSLFPSSKSLEEENSYNDPPGGQALRLSQLARLSPDDWVFPRMKLY